MNSPSLLEEFSIGLNAVNSNPATMTMANAKWIAPLLCAISESGKGTAHDIESISLRYKELAKSLLVQIGADQNDSRLLNTAIQAIINPATKEITKTGKLHGEWLNDYAKAITLTPAFFKVATSPVSAATSLGMTLTNHYADLFATVNEFAFLREPTAVVTWANQLIDTAAKQNAAIISPHEDHGSAYQNQLNVNRTLFKSVYKTEAKPWIEMLNDHPSTVALYVNGLPLTGVETRFNEQCSAIKNMLNIHSQSLGLKIAR